MNNSSTKGIVVAGTQSGCGKTTLSLGLMAAFADRGLKVAPFKVGPDFIDPGHHQRVTGRVSRNLDGWMLDRDTNRRIFVHSAAGADIAVVEGVMGLFDGYDGLTEAGSSAQMSKWMGLPVVLVVDASSMARSAAALVQGFENFDAQLNFAGVIFNRIGSRRHLQYLQEALKDTVRLPCLGGLARSEAITIPERHLGLVTREDFSTGAEWIAGLSKHISEAIDLDRLLSSAVEIDPESLPDAAPTKQTGRPVRVGVARDQAFCFYYQDNFDLLAACGAELVEFSPIDDITLPPDLGGIYIGGGYPELYADKLAANHSMRKAIRAVSRKGMPIYAECGGLMYIGKSLQDQQGQIHAMADCLPVQTRMLTRRRSLGYRQVTIERPTVLGSPGQILRGHEFHYSEISSASDTLERVYRITDRRGREKILEGYAAGNTLGSYVHLHFGSHPPTAAHFVDSCRRYRKLQRKA